MDINQTILMNLKKLGFLRLGAEFFVGKIPAVSAILGVGSFCNLGVYPKLFDNKLCYLNN